jgi:hypothetical protein
VDHQLPGCGCPQLPLPCLDGCRRLPKHRSRLSRAAFSQPAMARCLGWKADTSPDWAEVAEYGQGISFQSVEAYPPPSWPT